MMQPRPMPPGLPQMPLDAMMAPAAATTVQGYDEADDTEYIGKLVGWFEDAVEATDSARRASERDRDYYDNKQLTSDELASLKKRGQPDIIVNRIQPKIDYLIGYEASNRTDPRGFPRTPMDEDAAEACTDALRFVKDDVSFDQCSSMTWENLLIEGFGGCELVVDEANGEIDVVQWDWDRLFYDPHSRKPDFSDARYLGGVIWMDADEAKQKWPQAVDAIEITASENTADRTYDDRPWARWVSGKNRKRVRVVQMYHTDGDQWKWCIYTKGGKIDGGDVPFRDQDERSWCPMILQSAYVTRENERYGLVRIMIGPQDEINKRRSKALHMLVVKQVSMEEGAVDDVDELRAELAKPDGVIRRNPGFELEISRDDSQLTGHLQLLQEAKNEIELIGPNAAMLGKGQGDPSGRAILANQQGGQTELSRLMDRHRHWKRRVYIGIWNLIRQYKTAEWWVRVTDDEKNVKFVGFNRPVTAGEELAKRLEAQGLDPQQAQQQVQQLMQDPMHGQMLQQVIRMENVPAEMNMDVILEDVPDTANVQMEQFQALTTLAPAVTFPPEIYIKASSLRNKTELLETLDGQKNPEAEAKVQQMALEKAMLELDKLRAEIVKINAEAADKLTDADMKANPMGQITRPQIVDGGPPPQPQPQMMPPQQIPPQQAGF